MSAPVPLAQTRCPLCGGANGCSAAATGRFDAPCWCREVTFPAALLAQVPAPEAGRACICRRCAESAALPPNLLGRAEPPNMRIARESPATPDVFALLEEHLKQMHELSPRESVHALDVSGLQRPEITFWTVRDEAGLLLGCGALKELAPGHGEVKSMRTPQAQRRRGAGRALLAHIIDEARRRGYARLSLETGSMAAFFPAQRLYESFGFTFCGPFGDYKLDPHSVFMTLALRDGAG